MDKFDQQIQEKIDRINESIHVLKALDRAIANDYVKEDQFREVLPNIKLDHSNSDNMDEHDIYIYVCVKRILTMYTNGYRYAVIQQEIELMINSFAYLRRWLTDIRKAKKKYPAFFHNIIAAIMFNNKM